MASYDRGLFRPKNPRKYGGDPTKIVYRSSWEKRYMAYLDQHPDVMTWYSEEVVVHYRSPLDPPGSKDRRYFPDFVVKFKDKEGNVRTEMIEIKPYSQTKVPVKPKRRTARHLNEVVTYAVNQTKWKYAQAFCERRGWTFRVLTEKELYGR